MPYDFHSGALFRQYAITLAPRHLVANIFTTHNAFFLHAAWLGQACAHCPIFPTAASRRSLARISVPVWGIILSDPLLIIVLHIPLLQATVFQLQQGFPDLAKAPAYPNQLGLFCLNIISPVPIPMLFAMPQASD
ncbi:hypothetical protein B566_EDAN019165 [Ephemera danica]|nr:hypothetical protein B566_EDAN019165 [Ephemera danica]